MPKLDTAGVPQAAHITVGMCEDPKCGKLHLIMFDKNEKPMVIGSLDEPAQLIQQLQDWAYIAATRRV